MKESLWLKIVRLFYGLNTKLDERQLADVERIGNNAYISLSVILGLGAFASLFIAPQKGYQVAYWFLIVLLLLAVLLVGLGTMHAMRKLDLYTVEITPTQKAKAVRKIIVRSVVESIIIFLILLTGAYLGQLWQGQQPHFWANWSIELLPALFCFAGTLSGDLHRLKVIKED